MVAQDKRSKEAVEIAEEWLRSLGLKPRRFSKQEMKSGKTPDFRVFKDEELVFFCEVKSPRDDFLDDLLNEAELGEIVGGLRNDPTHNRISAHIYTASKQLLAVNPKHERSNVLVIVNYDEDSDFMDISQVITGNFIDDTGKSHPIYKKYSEGRTKKALEDVDVIVWFDEPNSKPKYFSTTKDINRYQHLSKMLENNPD